VRGDAVGEVLFYGQGAGQMPAASAVVSDLIDVALGRAKISLKELNIYPGKSKIVPLKPMGKIITRYYLRVTALDEPGVLAQVAGILGKHKISISSVIQQESGKAGAAPVVIRTHQAREENMQKALKEIDLLKVIKGKSALLRVEG
jgi:homoserine dehydrogenase